MASQSDRAKRAMANVVRNALPEIDFLALYPSAVVTQALDGTLDLRPDSQKLPTYQRVPIRHGIPGAKVKVAAGTRVLLGFAGGDSEHPFAALWEEGSVIEIQLGGTTKVARLGDTVAVAGPAAPGSMQAWVAAVTTYVNALVPGTLVPPTNFGTISTGSDILKSG